MSAIIIGPSSVFSSLTTRVFVASALLAVVSIALWIYNINVNVAVTTQAKDELLGGLAEARTFLQVEHFTLLRRGSSPIFPG